MRTRLLSMLGVAALVLSACGAAEWNDFTSVEGRFSVTLPGTPNESSQRVPSAVGDIEMHMFLSDQGASGFAVAYFDMPADLLAVADAQLLLDGAIQGAFGNVGGTVESQTNITLDGFPGIEATGSFSFEGEDGAMKARVYVVNERIYQIYVAEQGGQSNSESVDRFLNSFKLAK